MSRVFERFNPLVSGKELGYSELLTETSDAGRFYTTPHSKRYPSITTVLGVRSKEFLTRWRERVGPEKAEKIGAQAAYRGSEVHDLIERYLGNQEINQTRLMPHIAQNFRAAKEVLDARLGRILMQETPLYSDHLGLAGRVDLIAEFDGRLSIIDFKTSAKVKKAEDITSYFIQEAAYAIMCEERTGIPVANLVTILMVDYRKEALVFRERRDSWTSELFSVIQEYSAQVV